MEKREKKVGIMTLYYHNYNYGGLLQAYALTTYLNNKMNMDAEQIAYVPQARKKSFSELWDLIRGFSLRSLFGKAWIKFGILVRTIVKPNLSEKFVERKRHCDEFRNKIPHSMEVTDKELERLNGCYDIFVAGSDQIWNPNMFRSAYFLSFADDEKQKAAYAASMAVNSLSTHQKNKLVPLIDRFDYVSVREKRAMDMLAECMPQKGVETVLDPVLLLERQDWDEIVKSPLQGKKYVYAYFLGERKYNIKLAKKVAAQTQLPIATVPYIYRRYNNYDHDFGNIEIFDAGPDDFVGLIKDAEIVLTDSFHATVFSIIYKKNFWVFDRDNECDTNSMNSRLTFLLEELGLSDRRLISENQISEKLLKNDINYDKIDALLKVKREASIKFLYKAVHSERERL